MEWFGNQSLPARIDPTLTAFLGIRKADNVKGAISVKKTKKPQKGRRANNDGTIYQAANGSWVAQLTIGRDAKGKLIRKTFSAPTEEEAVQRLHKARILLSQGKLIGENRPTVNEWAEMFLTDFKEARLSPTTMRSYQQILQRYVIPAIGGIRLEDVRTIDIQRIVAGVTRKGRSSGTAIKVHAVMSSLFATAQKARLIKENPASTDWCEKPKYIPSYEESVPSQEQIGALVEAAEQERNGAAILLGIGTGMRLAEVIGLKWQYVNLEGGYLTVVRTVVDLGGKPLEKDPKSDSSKRIVVLPQIVVEALKRHREKQEVENKRCKRKTGGVDWVFTAKNGQVLNPRNFRRQYYKLLVNLGLEHLRFKAFRHGQATLLGEQSVPVKTTQARLGHSDPKVTLRYYTHVNKALQEPAAKQVDEYMERARAAAKEKKKDKNNQ